MEFCKGGPIFYIVGQPKWTVEMGFIKEEKLGVQTGWKDFDRGGKKMGKGVC